VSSATSCRAWPCVSTVPPKRARLNRLTRHSVFAEKHACGALHYHFPCLAEMPWSFVPLTRALRMEGIYVDFSCTHDYYWTTIVYLAVPDSMPGRKTEADLDHEPWLSPGHPAVRELLEDMPRGARGMDKARVRRYLGLAQQPAHRSKDVSLSDKEFAAHLVDKKLRTQTEVLAWVKRHGDMKDGAAASDRLVAVGMDAYCFKHQADLPRRVAFAWERDNAPQAVADSATTAWEDLINAQQRPCECGGRWIPMTEQLLGLHCHAFPPRANDDERPLSGRVRQAIQRALREGCKKFVNVFFYGPNTSGKSHVTKPLMSIFGQRAFKRPVGRGNFPLQGIFGKKVCVLQDVRVNTFKVGFDSLLVWWEGESFPVPLPQNLHKGDRDWWRMAALWGPA
jgi:hypothetical protein